MTNPITRYFADVDPRDGVPSLLLKRVSDGGAHRDFIMSGEVSFWDLDRHGILAASLRLPGASGLIEISKDAADAFLALSSDWIGSQIELGPQIGVEESARVADIGHAVDSFPDAYPDVVKDLLRIVAVYAEANQRLRDRHAMDRAYRPEIASGVAVKLTEESDWAMIAQWCGGSIVTHGTPDESYEEIVIPGVGTAHEGSWVHMDAQGVITLHADVFWPVAHEKLTDILRRDAA